MIRVDAVTGAILGEYRTAPQGLAGNPSRTSVDSQGNVWIGNADEESPLPQTSRRAARSSRSASVSAARASTRTARRIRTACTCRDRSR